MLIYNVKEMMEQSKISPLVVRTFERYLKIEKFCQTILKDEEPYGMHEADGVLMDVDDGFWENLSRCAQLANWRDKFHINEIVDHTPDAYLFHTNNSEMYYVFYAFESVATTKLVDRINKASLKMITACLNKAVDDDKKEVQQNG